ncbi:MAG: ATP synthase F1 subunit gamma [Patescibacteria group bacterium]|jgi:F-type H+-transporting ATPase subunit gamma
MAKTKEISRRIKSVSSTKKITKAMEMVAAAKMRKAIEAVLKTRTYANLSWETILHLAKLAEGRSESLHPLLTPRPVINRVAIVLITSNRGMCGGYNTAVISKAKQSIKKHQAATDFILVGRKGASIHQAGHNIAAEFEKSDIITDVKEIYPLVKLILNDYQSGKYDKVFVAYTDFVNPAKQVPRVKQILPVEIEKTDEYLGAISRAPEAEVASVKDNSGDSQYSSNDEVLEYTFEPSPLEVLNLIIPRLLEVQMYQAFLEANASEHSARMTAMHQATEAANDMVSELTLFYNKARQAGITAEIAEISAGANALA